MKKRALTVLGLVALIYVSVFAGALFAANASHLSFFPFVANAASGPATVCDGSAPLLDQDTGSLSAIRDADGRYIIAYQDRAHGGLAHVAQHVGAALEEMAAPQTLAALPSFSPTGVKQGSLALVPSAAPGQKSRLYYTQRKAGDLTGPYGIWCMEF